MTTYMYVSIIHATQQIDTIIFWAIMDAHYGYKTYSV